MTTKWLWDFSRVNKMQDFCHENNLPLMFLWMPALTSHTSLYSVKNFSVEQCVDAVSAKLRNEAGRFIDLHDADKDEMHIGFVIFGSTNLRAASIVLKNLNRVDVLPFIYFLF